MDTLIRCPTEPKQCNWYKEATNHSRIEPILGGDSTMVCSKFRHKLWVGEPINEKEGRRCDCTAYADGKKGETNLTVIESILKDEDVRKRLKESVENRKIECHVDTKEQDNRLSEQHMNRSKQIDYQGGCEGIGFGGSADDGRRNAVSLRPFL
jgi:hypothetical protein